MHRAENRDPNLLAAKCDHFSPRFPALVVVVGGVCQSSLLRELRVAADHVDVASVYESLPHALGNR